MSAISVTSAMNDRICIASQGNITALYSQQKLVSCCEDCGNRCSGGYTAAAWRYKLKKADKWMSLCCTNSKKINVKGFEINYFQLGNGPQKLLIFPGVLGLISDFDSLTKNLDGEKYTIIYMCDRTGNSLVSSNRPPNRVFSPGFLYRDADCAIALMETLGIDRYSMLGWCYGGRCAMIAASRAADRVDKLVVWCCSAYVTANVLEIYDTTRDVHSWPEDAYRKILDDDDGDVCRGALAKINAPTLILLGAEDVFVPVEHGVYLHENIKRSTLEIFPEGGHVMHKKYPEKFASIVDNFLSEEML